MLIDHFGQLVKKSTHCTNGYPDNSATSQLALRYITDWPNFPKFDGKFGVANCL